MIITLQFSVTAFARTKLLSRIQFLSLFITFLVEVKLETKSWQFSDVFVYFYRDKWNTVNGTNGDSRSFPLNCLGNVHNGRPLSKGEEILGKTDSPCYRYWKSADSGEGSAKSLKNADVLHGRCLSNIIKYISKCQNLFQF